MDSVCVVFLVAAVWFFLLASQTLGAVLVSEGYLSGGLHHFMCKKHFHMEVLYHRTSLGFTLVSFQTRAKSLVCLCP